MYLIVLIVVQSINWIAFGQVMIGHFNQINEKKIMVSPVYPLFGSSHWTLVWILSLSGNAQQHFVTSTSTRFFLPWTVFPLFRPL